MRLDFKVVVVRNALRRRLRIVAAAAILVRQNGPEALLVAERVSTMSSDTDLTLPGVMA
jgi:hypothetical protein